MGLTEAEKGYIAGFLDGEGCITIVHSKSNPSGWLQVSFTNTNKSVLDWIQKRTQGKVYLLHKGKGNQKPSYILHTWALQAKNLLKQLLPHLQIKREVAELALQWQNTKTYGQQKQRTLTLHKGTFTTIPPHILKQRQHLETQIHTLNHRGTKPQQTFIKI